MVTMGEQRMWHDISNIARSLSTIANCMESAEMRARKKEADITGGPCSHPDCENRTFVVINGERWCNEHLDDGFAKIADLIGEAMVGPETP
jgi:hypothetical protein